MTNLQTLTDKVAIGLSLLCAAHCLAFPLIIVMLPSLATLQIDGEAFHWWLLAAVIPTSVYALSMGCKKHKRYQLLTLGFCGLACLIAALILGEIFHSETTEKSLTLLGAALIAYGHFKNYRLCQQQRQCANVNEHHAC